MQPESDLHYSPARLTAPAGHSPHLQARLGSTAHQGDRFRGQQGTAHVGLRAFGRYRYNFRSQLWVSVMVYDESA